MKEFLRYKVTYSIIAINSVVYLFSAFFSGSITDMDMQVLVDMGALYGPLTVLKGEWWRLFTAMFLHGGMTHILMNMVSLYIIGRGMEMYFDTKSYLSIYLFSGLLGGLVSLYIHPASVGIGASGAIFGVFGALAGFFIAHRKHLGKHTKAFMKEFTVIIVINLVIGFSIPNVDVSAHVAGTVVGFIGGYLLSKDPKFIGIYSGLMVLLMLAIMAYLPTMYVQTFT
ncbi:rhomboid family intramembrane serine protease [Sulfurovum sp. NBC37-1]|uniref:rhomboid family intramembrane serine protease n=1 Tax=Sulfurovum sp. (strain NBC37-1) TaxID=387093 RepID=UPI0005A11B86|nr:rhomboid family intramembrane serine protease [Sulfurovum sp. NBC37-1]